MDKANKTKPRDPMREIVFGGGPPPPLPKPAPVPEVRRDGMGRPISETVLEALRKTQFKPGVSGNPGGRRTRQRDHALALITWMMRRGELKPSDTVAALVNKLNDAAFRALNAENKKFFRALKNLNRVAP